MLIILSWFCVCVYWFIMVSSWNRKICRVVFDGWLCICFCKVFKVLFRCLVCNSFLVIIVIFFCSWEFRCLDVNEGLVMVFGGCDG